MREDFADINFDRMQIQLILAIINSLIEKHHKNDLEENYRKKIMPKGFEHSIQLNRFNDRTSLYFHTQNHFFEK